MRNDILSFLQATTLITVVVVFSAPQPLSQSAGITNLGALNAGVGVGAQGISADGSVFVGRVI